MKRGEVSSGQIVGVVLAVAALFILLGAIYFSSVDFNQTDKEICRISILARATAPSIAQAAVPLQCGTEKVCITSDSGFLGIGKGKCAEFAGEENVRTETVKSGPGMSKEIERILAENMYTCWTMTGQGKLDLFGRAGGELWPSADSSCIICSRVAFAEDITNQDLANLDLDTYLKNNYIPLPGSSLTYLEAFTDRGLSSYPSVERINQFTESDEGVTLGESTDLGQLRGSDGRQMAFVFSQVKVPDISEVLSNWGYLAGGAALGSTTVMPAATLRVVSNPYALLGIAVIGGGVLGTAGLNAYWQKTAAVTYCGDFTSEEGLENGCSTIQGIGYNVQDINALCDVIHSNP